MIDKLKTSRKMNRQSLDKFKNKNLNKNQNLNEKKVQIADHALRFFPN